MKAVLASSPHSKKIFFPFHTLTVSCSWSTPHSGGERETKLCLMEKKVPAYNIYNSFVRESNLLHLLIEVFVYISVGSRMFISYFGLWSNTMLFILSLKLFQLWLVGSFGCPPRPFDMPHPLLLFCFVLLPLFQWALYCFLARSSQAYLSLAFPFYI